MSYVSLFRADYEMIDAYQWSPTESMEGVFSRVAWGIESMLWGMV